MISFTSDYIAGAHPKILERLVETNLENCSGYGTDRYCASAKEKILKACNCPEGQVSFLVGGTQTNQVVISTMLDSHEGVVAADTGHINVHEAGAIEYSGHKVFGLPSKDGKISEKAIKDFVEGFYRESSYNHMVFPGMVYISHPTEYGTLYSKEELEDIYRICKEYKLVFFVDGARLAYGLGCPDSDVTLTDLASLCDVFYVGGTKAGALCGEAVVFPRGNEPAHFDTKIKQRGAMLAKGRLLGIQFDTLFTDDLYLEIGRYGIEYAYKIKELFGSKGYKFFLDSPTNQQFVILDNNKMNELEEKVSFDVWEKYDDNNTVVRFATSWSTTQRDLDELEKLL